MLTNYGSQLCGRCGHSWHGLPCQHGTSHYGSTVLIRVVSGRLANRAPDCECPSSFQEVDSEEG